MIGSKFLAHIIAEICNYAVKNEMDPEDTLSTVADNIKDLLTISTFRKFVTEKRVGHIGQAKDISNWRLS